MEHSLMLANKITVIFSGRVITITSWVYSVYIYGLGILLWLISLIEFVIIQEWITWETKQKKENKAIITNTDGNAGKDMSPRN